MRGAMDATMSALSKRQDEAESKLDSLDEKYVPYRHFDAISKHVEESLRRIEVNVSKLTNFILTHSDKVKSD